MLVVGLSGYKRAGKDSVADILVRDYGFTKMAFADPIKEMVRNLDPLVGYSTDYDQYCCTECSEPEPMYLSDLYGYGWTDDMIKDSEFGDEVRRVWQRFGTEVMRSYHEDFWIHRAADNLLNCHLERIVFTDVRFENEAEFIFELGVNPVFDQSDDGPRASTMWRIHREPGPDHIRDIHESEQMIGMLGEEVTILNKGTLKDLEEPVAIAMDMLLSGVHPRQQQFNFLGLLGE